MKTTYIDFIKKTINEYDIGKPIYLREVSQKLANEFHLNQKDAAAAASVAMNRMLKRNTPPNLRFFRKGIFYLTKKTPFGEVPINQDQLIIDKYLLFDNGYESGLAFLHRLGLTTQMPANRVITTNHARDCIRKDEQLNVFIKPPKTVITADNKKYLQLLDAIELMTEAPIDDTEPFYTLNKFLIQQEMKYRTLVAFADMFYGKQTILQVAHIASYGGKNE